MPVSEVLESAFVGAGCPALPELAVYEAVGGLLVLNPQTSFPVSLRKEQG
jgi:hypothetical protein